MRAFFALPVATELKQQLAAQRLSLEAQLAELRLRWVSAENYHITLAFLGEVASDDVAELTAIATAVASRHQPAQLSVTQVEWFPSAAKPRLLAALVAESSALQALQDDLVTQLTQLGVQLSKQPFRPHISLAYAPRGLRARALVRCEKPLFTPMSTLVLFESQRRVGGSHYRALHTSSLARS